MPTREQQIRQQIHRKLANRDQDGLDRLLVALALEGLSENAVAEMARSELRKTSGPTQRWWNSECACGMNVNSPQFAGHVCGVMDDVMRRGR